MTKLTPDAKSHLSTTVRALRERLLRDIRDAADSDYRLSVRAQDSGLDEAHRIRRRRLEEWLDERVRAAQPKNDKAKASARERFLDQAVKETAATLLNRLVLIRHMEALGLLKPAVVTGGWDSKGYRDFRDFAQGLLGDETEGYAQLLELLFDELAQDLPGLFGDVGVTRLFRVPASTLREVVEQLDDPLLETAWTDDTTLGWVYQYWNDPEREALDAKINAGGKVEPHEIASKTQMFTERYMVEWLLHNSLGFMWLCMCKKHGWKPDAELVLDDLDRRRADWREKREKGEVALDELMPISEGLEDRWKYYVPQPIPDDAVESAPESIRDLKILDPACGSGHFLVIAFDLLVELYREEARHRGESWDDMEIAESILERNLHGVDIDPRAIQIAAAGLYLKTRSFSPDARVRKLNLVAPALNLAGLPEDDPALAMLVREVQSETGIPGGLTRKLVSSLSGVDYLGSLLKLDAAVDEAMREYESSHGKGTQLEIGDRSTEPAAGDDETRATVQVKIEDYLSRLGGEEDLGLRTDGEQLAAGVRFVRVVRERRYHIVIGNPPYQGTTKMVDAGYVGKNYPHGKADLFAAFLERSLELLRQGGVSALLTMRGWMFIHQFGSLREHLLQDFDLRTLGDIDRGGFEDVPDEIVATSMNVILKSPRSPCLSVAMQPTPLDDNARDNGRTNRKRAAVLAQVGRFEFDPQQLGKIVGSPLVYWWDSSLLSTYSSFPTLGKSSPARFGLNSGNNRRFVRKPWELHASSIYTVLFLNPHIGIPEHKWTRYLKGSAGARWFDPCDDTILWYANGLEVKVLAEALYGSYSRQIRNERVYWKVGVSFSKIGASFGGRLHRYRCVIDSAGSSVYSDDNFSINCLLNSSLSRQVMESLNPTVNFQVGDVNRLPLVPQPGAADIVRTLHEAFTAHESHRETSGEFISPGPSPWRYAQEWAQAAVDRPEGTPLPDYVEKLDPEHPTDGLCFALGVALGRFGANGGGTLDTTNDGHKSFVENALPVGILFLSAATEHDSLDHPACAQLSAVWEKMASKIGGKVDVRSFLRKDHFNSHRSLYENRPIYLPLSSAKKTFVAYVLIHRWKSDTLQTLLAEHLLPERRRLDGELEDLRKARAGGSATNKTEKRFAAVKKAIEELEDFIAKVTEIANTGPPPTDSKCPDREADSPFEMDLGDGVMVNSAALWPLLEPQWKAPKKWWKELATAKGKKDYDWSHLAARYFPSRVDAKCQEDPSFGVAHGCFWKYHPAKAYQWELRLQDEIRPDFTIDENGSDEYRARFLEEHTAKAEEIRAKEMKRREKKRKKEAKDKKGPAPLLDTVGKGKPDA